MCVCVCVWRSKHGIVELLADMIYKVYTIIVIYIYFLSRSSVEFTYINFTNPRLSLPLIFIEQGLLVVILIHFFMIMSLIFWECVVIQWVQYIFSVKLLAIFFCSLKITIGQLLLRTSPESLLYSLRVRMIQADVAFWLKTISK